MVILNEITLLTVGWCPSSKKRPKFRINFHGMKTSVRLEKFQQLIRSPTFRSNSLGFIINCQHMEKTNSWKREVHKRSQGPPISPWGQQRHVHNRPIWFQDERRLIEATSTCTIGLEDRALIRVLVHSGAEAHDASQTLADLHAVISPTVEKSR